MAGSRHWVSMDDIAAGDYPGGDNPTEQRALTFDEVVELLAVAETEAEVHAVLGHVEGEGPVEGDPPCRAPSCSSG